MTSNIAIIGNVSSLGYLMGEELRNRGFYVDHYCLHNPFCSMPDPKYLRQMDKIYNIPFERTIRKLLFKMNSYDLEIRLSAARLVRANHSVIVFNGSDLRDATMKPEKRCFVTTRDLCKYVQDFDARFLPRCIDTRIFARKNRISWREGEPLIIGHFPTDKKIKGTELVLKAVESLRSMGYDCNLFSRIVNHNEMPEYLSNVHVLCDQFTYGMYGIVSVEALAVGTPVVCHVKEEDFDYSEMKQWIVNCEPTPQSIAKAILHAVHQNVDSHRVKELYSPQYTVDILLEALSEWKMV